jgi:hypothetical protein
MDYRDKLQFLFRNNEKAGSFLLRCSIINIPKPNFLFFLVLRYP